MNSLEILKHYWGYDHFRPSQAEIIQSVLERKDVLALLPTGGGKSICFQVPAMILEGVCIVITPLIALMEDQVHQLKRRGIAAVAVHSGMSHSQIDITIDNCVYGKIKFLYLSPERLQTEMFIERVKKMTVCLIAVDEAHCISQWGYDFRPPYLKIAALRELKPDVPFIAVTASATKVVKEDIIQKLELYEPAVFQQSFARDNLSFVVRKSEKKEKQLLTILKKVPGSSIVYVRSRKATQELARMLSNSGISAIFYHAGLSYQERSERQKEWIENKSRVMVATNAFGMGIDKPDVRTVAHMDLPENLESYYQEAGRAGRDGKRAYAVILFHEVDVLSLQSKIQQSQPTLEYLNKIYQSLANYFHLAVGSSEGESYEFDLDDFCKRFSFKSVTVYAALKKLEEAGLIQLNEGFYRPSRVHILVDKTRLYEFQIANEKYDPLVKSLMRLYGATLFSEFVNISENQLSSSLKWPDRQTRDSLQQLTQLQIIEYVPASEKPQITYLLARQDAERLPVDRVHMEQRRELIFKKMNAMIDYVQRTDHCRMQLVQEYFDEETFLECGICDVCLAKKKKENLVALKDYKDQVFYLLSQKPMTPEQLEDAVSPGERELFIEVLREMVDANEIRYDEFWVLHKIV